MVETAVLARLLPAFVNIARAAGGLTLRWWRPGEALPADAKADGSPVTEADRAAEVLIASALRRLTPSVPVIGEEAVAEGRAAPETVAEAAACWLVDPVDGTREFVAGRDSFTVNLGLLIDGVPTLGVIDRPAVGETYWALTGVGAFRRRGDAPAERLSVRPPPAEGLTVVASRSHDDPAAVKSLLADRSVAGFVQVGSSLKFCAVAAGEADFYPRLGPTSEWDTAAGHAIVAAAGGRVRTLTGEPLTYGKPGLINPGFVVDADLAPRGDGGVSGEG